ncbi:flavin-containing monooxygenase [Sarracenia purpurea var. burkii]
MEKQVAIIGAGLSGLLACKYTVEKGFRPIVFEAEGKIGGVWTKTIESTKLQNTKEFYQFFDFPWPPSVKELYPNSTQVKDYIESYALHFALLPYVKFNSKVMGIDYDGESDTEMESWELWGGTGKTFGSRGKWRIIVQEVGKLSIQEYEVEFVILCIGQFSGVPNIPEFNPNHGLEVFKGNVMHSMDYSAMENSKAAELIKGKRIAIIGSQKSAVDIAAECANANGIDYPCTMIQRTVHWMIPAGINIWGVSIGYLYFNRFSELLVHKPDETFLHSILATLLSPLSFRFCREGLVIDENRQSETLKLDLVILATGYKGDEKLKRIFLSRTFQNCIMGSQTSTVPLYRSFHKLEVLVLVTIHKL